MSTRRPRPPWRLPRRAADSHKGTFGRVLIVAGSRSMAGAARLCAESALRAGSGLVSVVVPVGIHAIVAGAVAEAIVMPAAQTGRGALGLRAADTILGAAARHDVLAIGPGLGTDVATRRLVRRVVAAARCPIVVDADGLNALAGWARRLAGRRSPTILTPHPGEMARLAGTTIRVVQRDRAGVAQRCAARWGAVVCLKGAGTIVADGRRAPYRNRTGNPGLATAGTGDVLTGVIASLLGQGLSAFSAAALGAYVHGLAGDRAARACGEASLLARDVLAALPGAIRAVGGGRGRR